MRKVSVAVLGVLMVACFAAAALAAGPRGTSTVTIKGKTVSVDYGQPSLKGRTTEEMLGKLQPGAAWRMGADTATSLKTETDLVFGDLTVPAGEYSLFMQRQEDNSWKLVFNKQHGQWGTEHDASQDLGSTPLKETKSAKSVETLTITLSKAAGGGTLTVKWGTLEVSTSFKAK